MVGRFARFSGRVVGQSQFWSWSGASAVVNRVVDITIR